MNISFEGIGREVVTMRYTGSLQKGNLCKISGDNAVSVADASGIFHGKVLEVFDDGTASVQLRGYIEIPYNETITGTVVGWQKLKSISALYVQRDANAREYLIVHHDATRKLFGIML